MSLKSAAQENAGTGRSVLRTFWILQTRSEDGRPPGSLHRTRAGEKYSKKTKETPAEVCFSYLELCSGAARQLNPKP